MSSRPLPVLLAMAFTACGAHEGNNAYVDVRPRVVVTPTLSELPDDKKYQVIDSARARPDPEQRRRDLKPKERKLEWGAAVGAAILGQVFSTSSNATIGTESIFDETGQLQKMKRKRSSSDPDTVEPPPSQDQQPDAATLVPWIQVKAPTPVAPSADPPSP